jgi:hypothetical protein
MTTDALDLDALQAALDAMTPGKWCHVASYTDRPIEEVRSLALDCGDYAPRLSGSFAHPDDARGVVALVAAAPALLSMARRAVELEEALRQACDWWGCHVHVPNPADTAADEHEREVFARLRALTNGDGHGR